jgi:amino acid adenylation domain-containing protein/non-ribosomal peptide synthase protein (TIGR01720 family)
MNLIELLTEIRKCGAQVSAEDGQLKIRGPKGSLDNLSVELRSALADKKKEILALLQQAAAPQRSVGSGIVVGPRPDFLPLSFAQQRLWFLEQQQGPNATYNVPVAARIKGVLDIPLLTQAINEIVARHEALRTTFHQHEGQAYQVIAPKVEILPRCVDLRTLGDREIELQKQIREENRKPFNLVTGPLLRLTLYRLDTDVHVVAITIHHIVSDGWSMGIVITELSKLYSAFRQSKPSPLAPLSLAYPDFACWQRQWLNGEVLDRELTYWKCQLADAPIELQLPTDYARPAISSYRGQTFRFRFNPGLSERLRQLARHEDSTLFMVLLAGFKVLLLRYTGQNDLVVGTAIANRNRREIEPLIGLFVNTLVLRTKLNENHSFREVLQCVRGVALDAYVHQDLPFERLVDELRADRDTNRNPLFQVLFAFQNAPQDELRLPGMNISLMPLDTGTAKFDLYLSMEQRGTELHGAFEFSTDLFRQATVAGMERHYEQILESVVQQPQQAVSALSLLSKEEEHEIKTAPNSTRTDYPKTASIYRLFESVAREYPESAAVCGQYRVLSYSQLNARANRLATRLLTLSSNLRGTCVGICMERSPEMLIAMLATLKTGAAYLPVDPGWPTQRLNTILDEAGVTLVLSNQHARNQINSVHRMIFDLDSNRFWDQDEDPGNLPVEVVSKELAYVMYTSGSTGTPKGVCIPHRAVVRLVRTTNYFEVRPDDVFLHLSAPSFDASTFEIWGALLNGCKLAVMECDSPSLDHIEKTIHLHGVTVLWLTAGLFHLMVDERISAFRSLKQLLAGGDSLSVSHVQRLTREIPDCVFTNGYGPTENTTFSCCYRITNSSEFGASVPIGKPISNTQAYIVDSAMRLVPPGVRGELVLGGDGLADCYLKRPGWTSERFIPNPFAEVSGERMYRTGDYARWLPDGSIEFLGRIDEQVKIRGFRIELEEIRNVLNALPDVKESLVIARDDESDHKRLVAYVVLNPDEGPPNRNALESEQISSWETLYQDTYHQTSSDPTFNIVGWNSTYTGAPIPDEEMREWVDATVNRIRALDPNRILEIGCGTGLLLYRLAPACERYAAVDFSQVALQQIAAYTLGRPEFANLTLYQLTADQLDKIENDDFDLIILNSVAQYFPSVDYLRRVLANAISKVRAAGAIFIGDIRNFALLDAYHASVEVATASAVLNAVQVADRITHRKSQEQELLIDAAFFPALQQHDSRITAIRLQPKHGRFHNELTKFRFDATLFINKPATPQPEVPWNAWNARDWSLERICDQLKQLQVGAFGLTDIGNARLWNESYILQWIGEQPGETSGHLRNRLQNRALNGIDPETLCSCASNLGIHCEVSLSLSHPLAFDAVFLPASQTLPASRETPIVIDFPSLERPIKPWIQYANNPLQQKLVRDVIPRIRQSLCDQLPDYMVPSAFLPLDHLPLTPNGKIDHRALPQIDRSTFEQQYVAPRTETEKLLADIWSEVLGVDRVGVHDNFFELGGDSILSIQIVARAARSGIHLRTRELFERQTVAELASYIARHSTTMRYQEAGRPTGDVPLTPIQRWFFSLPLPRHNHFNHSFFLKTGPEIDSGKLHQVLLGVADHHDSFRLRYQKVSSGWRQFYSDNGPLLDFEVIEVPHGAAYEWGSDWVTQIAASYQIGFDLAGGPLWRAVLFRKEQSSEGRLLFVIHHLICDGVSWRILIDDIVTGYTRSDAAKPLAPKTSSFQKWAYELNHAGASGRFHSDGTYWKQKMTQPVAPLPMDRIDSRTSRTSAVHRALSKETTQRLLRETAPKYHAALLELLISALAAALAGWTGQSTLRFDLEGHGREELFECDLSRTVGWFTSLFPLVLSLPASNSKEIVDYVKSELRAIPNKGISYGILQYLASEQSTKLTVPPASEISFNYLGNFDQVATSEDPLVLVGDSVGAIRCPEATSLYPLEINSWILNDSLHFEYTFLQASFQHKAVEKFANNVLEELQDLTTSTPQPDGSRWRETLHDIDLSEAEYQQLAATASQFAK